MRLLLFAILFSSFSSAEIVGLNPELIFDRCMQHFMKVTHLVRYSKDKEDPDILQDQSQVKKYIPRFLSVYHQLPPQLKKMFCHLTEVRIADGERNDTANMQPLYDGSGLMNGAIVEFDRNILDRNLPLKSWASWKEQLSFGGIRHVNSVFPWPHMPQIDTNLDSKTDAFLFYLLAHEFGHILDFSNKINQFKNGYAVSTWSKLSWETKTKIKEESLFPSADGLCFYSCKEGKHIDHSKIADLYNGFSQANFISTYAASHYLDDWAETVTYWAISQIKGATYSVDFLDDDTLRTSDLIKKFNSKKFEAKRKFVTDFFEGNILYPENKK